MVEKKLSAWDGLTKFRQLLDFITLAKRDSHSGAGPSVVD